MRSRWRARAVAVDRAQMSRRHGPERRRAAESKPTTIESASATSGGSRPSKTNCTSGGSGAEPSESDLSRSYWWRRKNEIVEEFIEEYGARAARPVSVRGGTNLREECTRLKNGDGDERRSKTWFAVLNEFLDWYNDYRHAHLVFNDPDGETVRGQMPNSHQPRYGDRYYARLKALERQMLQRYSNLSVALLTLTGSSKNDNGGWRCPADHLRDVINSWRPDRGRGVYHALRDSLSDREWEYALVVEKHQSGYGHVHVAVFVDGELEESDFHSAIDAHLRHCDIAHRDAHDYYSEDLEERPISVSEVNPALEPDQYGEHDMIGNIGSYIGEYIGAHGEPLFDRGVDELAFRAACWATGTQMVRFSNGANEMIDDDL
ncbi:MAG: hypothetical protein ABEJ42_04225, partial [Halobacteriaceae archaeon]